MPTHNVMSILQESAAIIKRAQAQQKSAQDISLVGGNPSELPGAEHDSAVPASFSAPDAEVSDGMGPESTRSAEGAGDDSPLTRGHALESDEAAPVVVNEVPLVTDNADADPKTAALCNDLLGSIRSYQKKQAERVAAKPAPVAAAKPAPAVVKPAAAPAAAPAATPAAPAATPAAPSADKEAFDLELTQSVLQKIAAITLSYEEGVEFVSNMLEKHAGRQAAESVIGLLVEQDQAAQKLAQEVDLRGAVNSTANKLAPAPMPQASTKIPMRYSLPVGDKAQNLASRISSQLGAAMNTPAGKAVKKYGPAVAGAAALGAGAMALRRNKKDDKKDEKKEASDLAQARAEIDYLYKLGQELADASAADIMGVLPEAGGAEIDPAVAEAGIPEGVEVSTAEELGGEGVEEEATIEDVAAALDILVSEGTIQPDEAEAVLQELVIGNDTDIGAVEPVAEEPVAEEPKA